ncbi:MAG TPA: HipA domain-containing protein [Acidimicrobiales bacterium]|nr:HipA domain-containing protein [Acidimicrobiales bacterium]
MADELAVWMYGSRVAVIDGESGRPRLTYTEEALRRYPAGTPLLSLSLPVRAERYPQGAVRPFLDGLLPEGEQRRAIAREVRVDPADTYNLVWALGRDCAGAIVILPDDEPGPPPASTLTAEPLDEEALAGLVANLRSAPLGVTGRVRLSLAGAQQKLLLTRMPDGSWGRPVDGTPSTHILKPEIAAYPETVENEAFCMRIARHLGLAVAHVETTQVMGRKLIVVERYDRIVGEDGSVERVHQEDLCQATGTLPDRKYQEDGGPSLARLAAIIEMAAEPKSLETLLRYVTVIAVIGNGDAHAKNFSILHDRSGALRLAPLYDLLCTLCYREDRLAMYVDDVRRTNRVTADRIIDEAVRWGLSRSRATDIVDDILDRATPAITAAREQTQVLPDSIVMTLETQLSRLRGAGRTAA